MEQNRSLSQSSHGQTAGKVRGISLRIVVVLGIFFICLLALYYLTDEIVLEKETRFDESVFRVLHRFESAGITKMMRLLTFFGSVNFLFPAYLLLSLYFIFFKKNTVRSLNIAAIGISSGILLRVIKMIFKRHRPPNPVLADVSGFSYPSGHSFSSFTLVGILIYLLWETKVATVWKCLGSAGLFVFAVLIAGSRVYLHVHYGSDVLAGFFLSFVWLALCIFLLKKINKRIQPVNT